MITNLQKTFSRLVLHYLPHSIGFLSVVGFASCTASLSGLSPETLSKRGLKPGEGLIVGRYESVCIDRSRHGSPSLVMDSFLRASATDRKDGTNIIINNGTSSGILDFIHVPQAQPDSCFAIPVPAGNYEIDGWLMTANGYGSTIVVRNRLPMKVPFQVRAGEATYLGKVGVVSINNKNFLGLPAFAEGVILIADQFDKDSGEISTNFASIRRSQIHRSDVPQLYAKEMKRVADTPRHWWDGLL